MRPISDNERGPVASGTGGIAVADGCGAPATGSSAGADAACARAGCAAEAASGAPCEQDGVPGSAGRGPVPAVLLHGFAQDETAWDEVVPALRAAGAEPVAARIVAPASGRSADAGCAVDASSMDAACADTAALVRRAAMRFGRPVLLAGYSMGGRIAFETAAREDGLPLAGLVLESAGLGPADDAERAAYRRRNEAWARDLRACGVAAFMDEWESLPLFASQRALPDDVRRRVRARRLAHGPEELARLFEGVGAHRQMARDEALEALARRMDAGLAVLYIHGALDAKYAAVARRFMRELPAARVVAIAHAGHDVHLEAPRAFAAACADFVGRCADAAPPSSAQR